MVKVTDRQGQVVSGTRVVFAPDAAVGGSVSPDTVVTGANGLAAARWVLGDKAGSQTATAHISGLSGDALTDNFSATALAATATTLAAVSGDNQSAAAGTALAAPLVVIATDEFGNPVEGVDVTWAAQSGRVDPGSTATGADGQASTRRLLGSTAGTQQATAAAKGLDGSPVTFTHTATVGDASALILVSGNNQTGAAGAELAAPLVVRLMDSQGNPIAGSPVSWLIGAGGGSVVPSGNTDGDGMASATLTLGPTAAATNTANAVVSGVGVVTFTATASGGSGSATTLTIVAGDGQSADPGTAVPTRPSVKVTNDQGQGVAGFGVTFVVTGGNGSVTGAAQSTNSNGVATAGNWVLGDPGTNTLEARAAGLKGSPAVFTATANQVADHLVFLVQPDGTQQRNETITPPVQVAIVDKAGNLVPLSGVTVEIALSPRSNRLRGDRSRNTNNGVAVFDDLSVTRDGSGFVLSASAPQRQELGEVTSNSFDVEN
ncbi:MAG: Ig-like domain-containing protein [Actinoallomurus sp.]